MKQLARACLTLYAGLVLAMPAQAASLQNTAVAIETTPVSFSPLEPGKKRFVRYSVTYKCRKVGPELNTEKRREPL